MYCKTIIHLVYLKRMKKDILTAKRSATFILKITLLVMAIIMILLAIFAFPNIWKGGSIEFPTASDAVFLIMLGLYATTIPFFIALWQTFKLLRNIDAHKAFSDSSVRALKNIKYCAITIGILFMGGLPLLYPIAEADDAPGLLIFGFIFACIPIVVAVFAEVLERLLQNAIDIKSENDLTV